MKKLALFALFAFSAPVFGMEIHASQIFTLAGNIAYKRFEGPRDVQDAREFLDISNKRRCFVIKVVPGPRPSYLKALNKRFFIMSSCKNNLRCTAP